MKAFLFAPTNHLLGKFNVNSLEDLEGIAAVYIQNLEEVPIGSYIEIGEKSWTVSEINPLRLVDGRIEVIAQQDAKVKEVQRLIEQKSGQIAGGAVPPKPHVPQPFKISESEYTAPILTSIYNFLGWLTLVIGLLSALVALDRSSKVTFGGSVTLILGSLFLFGIAQVVDLIGRIEYNTRKQE